MSTADKRQQAIKTYPGLSLSKRCKILGVSRSTIYYKPKGESALNEVLMREIDRYFLKHPYYGQERMRDYLNLDLGHNVNIKRVSRLYKLMNLRTIYQAPKTTTRDPDSYIYSYLLRNLDINRPNQVWQTDITYIPMARGFMFSCNNRRLQSQNHSLGRVQYNDKGMGDRAIGRRHKNTW